MYGGQTHEYKSLANDSEIYILLLFGFGYNNFIGDRRNYV
jgi:hypothetical protein